MTVTLTLKTRLFINEPMVGKPVIDVPGVGEATARMLRERKVLKAEQLYSVWLLLKNEKYKFQTWLKKTCGSVYTNMCAERIVHAFETWHRRFGEQNETETTRGNAPDKENINNKRQPSEDASSAHKVKKTRPDDTNLDSTENGYTVTRPSETQPSDTRISVTRPLETPITRQSVNRPSETSPTHTRTSVTHFAETRPSVTRPSDTLISVTRPLEYPSSVTCQSETRPSETRPSETQASETRPTETRPSETRPSETQAPPETCPSETQASETRPTETRPSETRPSETQAPPETCPSETQASETIPSDTQASETRPSDTHASETCLSVTGPSETCFGQFDVAVVREDNQLLNESQVTAVNRYLEKSILESVKNPNASAPRFKRVSIENGALQLSCEDDLSLSWLKEAIANAPEIDVPKVIVKGQSELIKKFKVAIYIPDCRNSVDDTLLLLTKQNEWAQIKTWLKHSEMKVDSALFLEFLIPEKVVPALMQKGGKLSYYLGSVEVLLSATAGQLSQLSTRGVL